MMYEDLFNSAEEANLEDLERALNSCSKFPKFLKGHSFTPDFNIFEKPDFSFLYKKETLINESSTDEIMQEMTFKVVEDNPLEQESEIYLFSSGFRSNLMFNSLENLTITWNKTKLKKEIKEHDNEIISIIDKPLVYDKLVKQVSDIVTFYTEFDINPNTTIDIRTTCMIKNIPNNYSIQVLEKFINKTHWGKYDFLYLRMDFEHRCNAGYAFINFRSPDDVLTFYRIIDGKNWVSGLSKKIARLSYAKIQGFNTLVEKFKNSSIHEKEKIFRPKVFYTTGPMAGKERDWDDFRSKYKF